MYVVNDILNFYSVVIYPTCVIFYQIYVCFGSQYFALIS